MGGPASSRALAAFALAGLVVLAGCTSRDPPGAAPAAANEPTFDAETGALRGSVLTDEHLPVANAEVGLQASGLPATRTDAGGGFAFSHVPPGETTLLVAALGFEGVAQRVTIRAGETTDSTTILTAQAVLAAGHKVLLSDRGLVGCAVAAGAAFAAQAAYSPCATVALAGQVAGEDTSNMDDFSHEWNLSEPTATLSGLVLELEWQSNQALGKGLHVYWEVAGCVNSDDGEGFVAEARGTSPLHVWVDAARLHKAFNLPDGDCTVDGLAGPKDCTSDHCTLVSRVFDDAAALGQPAADAGVTFQQTFTAHLTAFHGPLPAGAKDSSALA